jgi:hypothetical protein
MRRALTPRRTRETVFATVRHPVHTIAIRTAVTYCARSCRNGQQLIGITAPRGRKQLVANGGGRQNKPARYGPDPTNAWSATLPSRSRDTVAIMCGSKAATAI